MMKKKYKGNYIILMVVAILMAYCTYTSSISVTSFYTDAYRRVRTVSDGFDSAFLIPYQKITGKEYMDRLKHYASSLKDKKILHVFLFSQGRIGSLVNKETEFLKALGLDVDKRRIKLDDYSLSKIRKFFSELQGADWSLSKSSIEHWVDALKGKLGNINAQDYDVIFFHGVGLMPGAKILKQEIGLQSEDSSNTPKLIWRNYADISSAQEETWNNWAKSFLKAFDMSIHSDQSYSYGIFSSYSEREILPAIDPLAERFSLSDKEIEGILKEFKIDPSRDIIVQVARMDYVKNFEDTLLAYSNIRAELDPQLVLISPKVSDNFPLDSIEGKRIKQMALKDPDVQVIFNLSSRKISAFLEAADVVVQPSKVGSMGTFLAEAMYRGTPVISSTKEVVDGIDKQTGFTFTYSPIGNAEVLSNLMKVLLTDKELNEEMGKRANKYARTHFLLPRLIEDQLVLLKHFLHSP